MDKLSKPRESSHNENLEPEKKKRRANDGVDHCRQDQKGDELHSALNELVAKRDQYYALQNASNDQKSNKDFVLAAVSQSCWALEHASDCLKRDKDIVLAAVTQDGLTLQYASNNLKAAKDVVLAAVAKDGHALLYASGNLKADWDVVLAAVTQDGRALKYASEDLRADKDVVTAAVMASPGALKYALGGLNQDRDCWVAAGLWKGNSNTTGLKEEQSRSIIVLSTKFSVSDDSDSSANAFTFLLNKNKYFQQGNFKVYTPNAFSKATCDPEWTRMEWPCRGTFETCKKDPSLKMGLPNELSCWRYSYRHHLKEARQTGGFMIQVVDFDKEKQHHALGKGQEIETVMAQEVGTKVFRIFRPVLDFDEGPSSFYFFDDHLKELVDQIQNWYNLECDDMRVCQIQILVKPGDMGNHKTTVKLLEEA